MTAIEADDWERWWEQSAYTPKTYAYGDICEPCWFRGRFVLGVKNCECATAERDAKIIEDELPRLAGRDYSMPVRWMTGLPDYPEQSPLPETWQDIGFIDAMRQEINDVVITEHQDNCSICGGFHGIH